jgi:hypothetical protein
MFTPAEVVTVPPDRFNTKQSLQSFNPLQDAVTPEQELSRHVEPTPEHVVRAQVHDGWQVGGLVGVGFPGIGVDPGGLHGRPQSIPLQESMCEVV